MRQLKIQKSITNRSSEALDKYLVEIGRAPLISIDEEIELAQKIKKGGPEGERAKDKLVTANLRFVVSVAKQYQHQGLTLTDLIDEGNIGLIKAAQKFDETRGFKFISYAVWWIRQSILQAIAEQSRIVRLPLNQVGSLNKINHEINKFEQENQRHPSVSELADATKIDEEKIGQSLMADGHHVSIDAPFQDGEDNCMLDVMPSGDDTRTDKQVDHESMAQELNSVLNKVLKDREITIIRECFGIGCHEKGLEEIGDQLGLTRERVRQIREKSIAKLRDSMAVMLLACLLHLPYGYYSLLRFVAMVVFTVLAYQYNKEKNGALTVTFGAFALLFQPFIKIALGRSLWNIIDVAVAIFLLILWSKECFGKEHPNKDK